MECVTNIGTNSVGKLNLSNDAAVYPPSPEYLLSTIVYGNTFTPGAICNNLILKKGGLPALQPASVGQFGHLPALLGRAVLGLLGQSSAKANSVVCPLDDMKVASLRIES